MCIAILNNSGKLSRQTIYTCWENNPDGAGFTYWNGNELVVIKELQSKKRFFKLYSQHRDKSSNPFAVHFRVATCGKIDATNCHPFKVSNKIAFIHNGVIPQLSDYKSNFSDTYELNELLKGMPEDWLLNQSVIELLSDYISSSKLVFIRQNEYSIINEHLGKWDDGNWFSNDTYKPIQKYRYYDGEKYSNYSFADEYTNVRDWQYCECCNELSEVKYVSTYNMDICHKCIKEFQLI